MTEFSDDFCAFNSWKGIAYLPHYKKINEWRLGERLAPPPPIEISLDLFAGCNLSCDFCNFGKYLEKDMGNKKMPDEHLMNLIEFLGNWEDEGDKVRGICFGGGGESTLHPKMSDALELSYNLGMQNAIATNGINITDDLLHVIPQTCKWIGFSIDASTSETYMRGKHGDYFNKVIENIKKLKREIERTKSKCTIAFKFLIFDFNQHEIYNACKIAKELGVNFYYVRPASFSHQGIKEKIINPYNVDLIEKQYKECHKLATKEFKVVTSVHKFNADFTPRRNFSQCWASSICLQINPNFGLYLCPDTRNLEFFKLGKHYPDVTEIKRIWGSRKHYDLVFKTGCKNCNWRCTYTRFNEQMERLVINDDDPMDLAFV